MENQNEFYTKAIQYWSKIPATVDGMLGGFSSISQIDIKDSKLLLKKLFECKTPPGREYALDCGAGIGRVSKHLLTHLFDKTDLVEQNESFLEQAKEYLGEVFENKIGRIFCTGLQDFKPESGKYDVIWCQWVLGHLTETDLVNFLQSSQCGLKDNGMIVVKENVASSEEIDMDETDSSVTRPYGLYCKLFKQAGLHCLRQLKQRNFPKSLYMVYMFVLIPESRIQNMN